MSPTTTVSNLLERNQIYSQSHTAIPTVAEIKESGRSAFKTLIISCTDGRIMPEKFLNITVPEEVLIVRNSGARARPALANLVALDDMLNVENVLVIGHTDCGARNFNEGAIRARLMKRAPEYKDEIERMQFGKILGDIEHSVRDDVEFLKGSPLLREELKKNIQGFVFDVQTGKLKEII
ncbi:hypothetical protein TCE0_034f10904 [Talaromyces pinophilus]|uniref:Carbonic anhydrase n=1 Tax=Talaromyces pinophilus TaxID=128442 RepID=A0A6V8HD40_TALPI|nr:hypothetical protein TCE0_034f10904 [Talaromyces pinophilus]